ncbi:MAG: class I SAM-dependent methyltransferase [Nitrospirales bacterium]|nr:methyltransferase domain-containing protein [Nitrospira sp.]MDR4502345.1 class I SAM-dependent methyltransferase [Nitrospirales bacterium]
MNCRICHSKDLDLAIDLQDQPWCNHFLRVDEIGTEPFYPLRVVYCHACHTPQLDYTVPKEVMFGNHTYLSGVTRTLNAHFQAVAQCVDDSFCKHLQHKRVLDIGSNDGTQLKHYQELGYDVLGIESSKGTADIATQAGIETIHAFADGDLLRGLPHQFHVINAAGVFFHLEELHSITDGIRAALHPDGVFVVQFLYMKQIVDNMAFDQIYHEHLLYYNLETIETLLNMHGLSMFDGYLSPIHGGSIIGFVGPTGKREPSQRLQKLRQEETVQHSNQFSTYQTFAEQIQCMKSSNQEFLHAAKDRGLTIYGFGAPVKGNTLLNYFEIGPAHLDCLVEKNALRRGLYSPGQYIPIVMEDELAHPPDMYYVLAWNFKEEILANNRKLIEQGVEFYFPIDPRPVLA